MRSDIQDRIREMLSEPFSYRDNWLINSWIYFCKTVLIVRYLFMIAPFYLKVLIGVPLYFFDQKVFITYILFIIWAMYLDKQYQYDYKESTFTIRRYFKVYLFKNVLFIAAALFMYEYYFHPYGWICSIYSIPMLLVAVGYVLPIFDKRIYK